MILATIALISGIALLLVGFLMAFMMGANRYIDGENERDLQDFEERFRR